MHVYTHTHKIKYIHQTSILYFIIHFVKNVIAGVDGWMNKTQTLDTVVYTVFDVMAKIQGFGLVA